MIMSNPLVESDRLLDDKEVAAILGWRVESLVQARCRGRLKFRYLKIGRSIRYRKSDVDAFLAECVVEPKDVSA